MVFTWFSRDVHPATDDIFSRRMVLVCKRCFTRLEEDDGTACSAGKGHIFCDPAKIKERLAEAKEEYEEAKKQMREAYEELEQQKPEDAEELGKPEYKKKHTKPANKKLCIHCGFRKKKASAGECEHEFINIALKLHMIKVYRAKKDWAIETRERINELLESEKISSDSGSDSDECLNEGSDEGSDDFFGTHPNDVALQKSTENQAAIIWAKEAGLL